LQSINRPLKVFGVTLLVFIYASNVDAQSLDEQLINRFHSNRNKSLDDVFKVSSSTAVPVSLLVPTVFFANGILSKNKVELRKSIVMVGALAVNTGLTYALKYSINRPRPYESDPSIQPLKTLDSPSFPSGHTSIAFVTATNITLAINKWYAAVPAYAWAASVGYARVHMGVHYPSDVLAGAIIGISSAWLSYKANAWLKTRNKQTAISPF
jgi:undecaprenyl-diphosphatase